LPTAEILGTDGFHLYLQWLSQGRQRFWHRFLGRCRKALKRRIETSKKLDTLQFAGLAETSVKLHSGAFPGHYLSFLSHTIVQSYRTS